MISGEVLEKLYRNEMRACKRIEQKYICAVGAEKNLDGLFSQGKGDLDR